MCVIIVFVSDFGCDIYNNVTTGAVSTFEARVHKHTSYNTRFPDK